VGGGDEPTMFNGWSRGTIALLASPIGLLVISATRLLVISNYNVTTATAIASSGGYINTVLGTLIPLVPLFLPYLALLFLLFRKIILSILTFIGAIFVSPTKLPPATSFHSVRGYWNGFEQFTSHHAEKILIISAILFVITLIAYNPRVDPGLRQEAASAVLRAGQPIAQLAKKLGIEERTLKNWVSGGKSITVASLAGAVLATAILLPYISYVYPVPRAFAYYKTLLRQPWIPPEHITLGSGGFVVGYPLSTGNGWMTVLVEQTRTIQYLPAGDVHGRSVCKLITEPQSTTVASAIISLSKTKPAPIPPCGSSGSLNNLASTSNLHETKWTMRSMTISHSAFRPITRLSGLSICAFNEVTATLSVELSGSPVGFRILLDERVMRPGRVRFIPAGLHDSFSFTFADGVKPLHGKDLHKINVEWRSPLGSSVTLERGTLALNYQSGPYNC
jgi:hypothetical protein